MCTYMCIYASIYQLTGIKSLFIEDIWKSKWKSIWKQDLRKTYIRPHKIWVNILHWASISIAGENQGMLIGRCGYKWALSALIGCWWGAKCAKRGHTPYRQISSPENFWGGPFLTFYWEQALNRPLSRIAKESWEGKSYGARGSMQSQALWHHSLWAHTGLA